MIFSRSCGSQNAKRPSQSRRHKARSHNSRYLRAQTQSWPPSSASQCSIRSHAKILAVPLSSFWPLKPRCQGPRNIENDSTVARHIRIRPRFAPQLQSKIWHEASLTSTAKINDTTDQHIAQNSHPAFSVPQHSRHQTKGRGDEIMPSGAG